MSDLWQSFEQDIAPFTEHISAEEFDYTINISLKHNYIYVENAKVACSTIKLILQRMELGDTNYRGKDLVDMHTRIFSPLIRPAQVGSFSRFVERPEVFKFCFVRDPYTRLLSAYLDKIRNNMPAKAEVLNVLGKDSTNLAVEISFSEFVEAISRQAISEMNPHWRLQYYQTFQDQFSYDFIGRFESIESDLKQAMSSISNDFETYWGVEKRHATNSGELAKQFYTADLEQRVFELYRQDFDTFGYERFKNRA